MFTNSYLNIRPARGHTTIIIIIMTPITFKFLSLAHNYLIFLTKIPRTRFQSFLSKEWVVVFCRRWFQCIFYSRFHKRPDWLWVELIKQVVNMSVWRIKASLVHILESDGCLILITTRIQSYDQKTATNHRIFTQMTFWAPVKKEKRWQQHRRRRRQTIIARLFSGLSMGSS